MKTPNETLLEAAKNGDNSIIKDYIQLGKADIETKDNNGQTALHLAAANGHTATVVLLLSNGANINAIDTNGCTPLHLSIDKTHYEVTISLIEKGADFNIKNKNGSTPIGAPGVVPAFHIKVMARCMTQMQSTIQSLNQTVQQLQQTVQQLQESMKQQMLTTKDKDSDSSDQKGYSPSFKFGNTNPN